VAPHLDGLAHGELEGDVGVLWDAGDAPAGGLRGELFDRLVVDEDGPFSGSMTPFIARSSVDFRRRSDRRRPRVVRRPLSR